MENMVKFKVQKGLESLVKFKKTKRQNIKKIISYLILGATIYILAYNCIHKPKLKEVIYNEWVK